MEPPTKRRKLMDDHKDSEVDGDPNTNNAHKTIVVINGQSDEFLLSDLLKIAYFQRFFSSDWNSSTHEAARQCVIECDSIHFGTVELKLVIEFISNSRLPHTVNLIANSDNILLRFLQCLDFFCLSSRIDVSVLQQYYQSYKTDVIRISDLHKLQFVENDLLRSFSVKMVDEWYKLTIECTVQSLKENVAKFKAIDIDSGFIIKDNHDSTDWSHKKIAEFAAYRKCISRDWIIIATSHKALQSIFIRTDLYSSIMVHIKEIFDTFCRFCSIKHMKPHLIDIDDKKVKNPLNDVKTSTFPMVQLMVITRYFLQHFDVIYEHTKQAESKQKATETLFKQSIDLIMCLPTMITFSCGERERVDDTEFLHAIGAEHTHTIAIYKDIIDILLEHNASNGRFAEISVMETLIIPSIENDHTEQLIKDEQWIQSLFRKSTQRDCILLALQLKKKLVYLQLSGHNVGLPLLTKLADQYLNC